MSASTHKQHMVRPSLAAWFASCAFTAAALAAGGKNTSANDGTAKVLLWVGVLIVLAMVGGVAIMMVRRRILAKDSAADEGLMQSLRSMRDSGVMSPEEYDATRKAMARRVAGDLSKGNAQTPESGPSSAPVPGRASHPGRTRRRPNSGETGPSDPDPPPAGPA